MASIITATTSSGLTQSADNSGVLQLASGSGNLVTVPSVTGTAMVSGNMPAFSAYQSSGQTISNNTQTKVQCNIEEFDTASCYDNATNYRFTPNVAGYYLVTGEVCYLINATTANLCDVSIWKNGSRVKQGTTFNTSTGAVQRPIVSALIYMNGTTDYLEFYTFQNAGASTNLNSSTGIDNFFQAFLARAA